MMRPAPLVFMAFSSDYAPHLCHRTLCLATQPCITFFVGFHYPETALRGCLGPIATWMRPMTMESILSMKAEHSNAKLVVGNSEVGIEMKFKAMRYPVLIHANQVPELNAIEVDEAGVTFGASVTLTELMEKCKELVASRCLSAHELHRLVDSVHSLCLVGEEFGTTLPLATTPRNCSIWSLRIELLSCLVQVLRTVLQNLRISLGRFCTRLCLASAFLPPACFCKKFREIYLKS